MAATATKLHSIFNDVVGCSLVAAVFLAGSAADFSGFLGAFDEPSIAAVLAIVCAGLRFRGLAFARAAWRRDDRLASIIFVVSTAFAVLISSEAEQNYFLSSLKSIYRSDFQEQVHQVATVLTIQLFSLSLLKPRSAAQKKRPVIRSELDSSPLSAAPA